MNNSFIPNFAIGIRLPSKTSCTKLCSPKFGINPALNQRISVQGSPSGGFCFAKSGFITNVNVSHLRAKLNQPFRVATGQHNSLDNLLLSLTLSDGTKGFGEAAVATHITGETIAQTKANLEKTGKLLLGKDVSECLSLSEWLHQVLFNNKSALAAIEMAMLDAFTRRKKMPLWKLYGKRAKKLTSDITIVIGSLDETTESIKQFYAQGFRTFKIKVGRDRDLDFKRILAFRKILPKNDFYLDANQGYSAKEMLSFLKDLAKQNIVPVLVEQPVSKKDWEGLCKVTREAKTIICADESVSSLSDAKRAVKDRAVGAINIKLMKTGLIESCAIAQLAHANKIKLMIGGMMETSLAMTASAHLAAGMGCFDFIDLDTPFFIKDGRKNNLYLSANGVYDLAKVKKGIGIENI